MDGAITWAQIGTLVALAGSLFGFYRWITGIEQAFGVALDREREERLKLERAFADYKVFVSQNHVSAAALRETEERLIAAVEKLATRMENVITRLDKLSLEMVTRRQEH